MRLFFNEYYRRKPERLWEKEGDVFCMVKSDEYDYEFISMDFHEKEIEYLKAEVNKWYREWYEEKTKHDENLKLRDELLNLAMDRLDIGFRNKVLVILKGIEG